MSMGVKLREKRTLGGVKERDVEDVVGDEECAEVPSGFIPDDEVVAAGGVDGADGHEGAESIHRLGHGVEETGAKSVGIEGLEDGDEVAADDAGGDVVPGHHAIAHREERGGIFSGVHGVRE